MQHGGVGTEDRVAAVHRYEILDAPVDGAFERVARMAAAVFDTPIATVSIVDSDRVWFAAAKGLDGVTQVGVEPGLCASAVLEGRPYIVFNAGLDPRTLEHPLVRGALGLRFYAAAPIVTQDGHALGTVTAIDLKPREPEQVTQRQTELLTELAGAVADVMETKLAALTALRADRLRQDEESARAEAANRLALQISEALGAVHGRQRPAACQLGGQAGCPQTAEVKIVDSWGDSAWGCYLHAEEALVNVPSVFLATESLHSLALYMGRAPATEISGGSTADD